MAENETGEDAVTWRYRSGLLITRLNVDGFHVDPNRPNVVGSPIAYLRSLWEAKSRIDLEDLQVCVLLTLAIPRLDDGRLVSNDRLQSMYIVPVEDLFWLCYLVSRCEHWHSQWMALLECRAQALDRLAQSKSEAQLLQERQQRLRKWDPFWIVMISKLWEELQTDATHLFQSLQTLREEIDDLLRR